MYAFIAVLVMGLGVFVGILLRKKTLKSNKDKIQSLREAFKDELNKKD